MQALYRRPVVKGAAHLCNGFKYNITLTHTREKKKTKQGVGQKRHHACN